MLWSSETTFAEVARVALAPPPDLRSTFRPTYNLAVNLVRRFDRERALEVLRQLVRPVAGRRHARRRRTRDKLAEPAGSTAGRARGAGLRPRVARSPTGGRAPRPLYHESDLLVAEALSGDVLDGAEPSVLAGVLSAWCSSAGAPDARWDTCPTAHEPVMGWPGAAPGARCCPDPEAAGRRPSRSKAGDRLGERRRAELAERTGLLAAHAETVRATEEVHLVPRTRQPEPGLAAAVAAWARGASFGTVLELAARDVGELAPGDFVRTVKQVADLADQVAVAPPIRRPRPRRMRPSSSSATSSQPVVRHPPLQAPTTRRVIRAR